MIAGALPRRGRALRLALCAMALGVAAAPPAGASDVTAPIEQLDASLLKIMKAGKSASFQQRYDMLVAAVVRAIDLDAILQGGVGASWTSFTADQQAALKKAFERYSVATYVANFDDFSGERFDLQPPPDAGDPVVKVKIVPGKPEDDTHTLGYVMRQTPGGWKAIDITADGMISQATVQKAEIRALLMMGGMPGLLARLQQKASELSGGTLH
ncbi:MAG TPA: ABC transporter substrate-binding protein [Stellaceae bacterium]|nr:ABC transporter substrate-binding protein [Stellaceae bacterium]